jgi:hypothetical protein
MERVLLTAAEVEALYGFSEKTLRSMRRRGLRYVRPTGHAIYYRRDWIDQYIEEAARSERVAAAERRQGAAALPRRRQGEQRRGSLLRPGRRALQEAGGEGRTA